MDFDLNSDQKNYRDLAKNFSDKELKSIKMHNIKERYLGQNILRAETAPIYVSSLIKNHFGKIS